MLTQPIENKPPTFSRRRLGKSVAHTEIQRYLKKQIPALELEKKINHRRADAVWEEKKIVFEIQLSPLTYEEAVQRSNDYTSYGYQVVWILHDSEFNQRNIGPAERFLRDSYPTYYTNGSNCYDQFEVVEGSRRHYQGEPLLIEISQPFQPFLNIPNRSWSLHFSNDLHTWCGRHGIKTLQQLDHHYRPPRGIRYLLYWIGFRLLEYVSRNPK